MGKILPEVPFPQPFSRENLREGERLPLSVGVLMTTKFALYCWSGVGGILSVAYGSFRLRRAVGCE